MSMILSDAEKEAVWNDREKLGETIKLLAIRLNSVQFQSKHWADEKTKAKVAMERAEANLKILEDEFSQVDDMGRELTRRLMELEKEAGVL